MVRPFLMGFMTKKAETDRQSFAELSIVKLTRAVEVGGRVLDKGARGTVVGAYSDGIGYEVEFAEPFHAVVTLEFGDLTA